MKTFGLGLLMLSLVGCVAHSPAPVSDRASARGGLSSVTPKADPVRSATPQITPSTNGLHTVQRGDTLYAIAFANSLDYRELSRWNQLDSPDRIMIGQVLRLTAPTGGTAPSAGIEITPLGSVAQPNAQPLTEPSVVRTPQAVLLDYSEANWAQASAPRSVVAVAALPVPVQAAVPPPPAPAPVVAAPVITADGTVDNWLWPAEGILAGRFGAAGGKGIDIVGTRNSPVKAVASGKVVYSGSGLRGYGQLLIVKHSGEFLSAYAHNETILVKEGDMVTAGQKIARMGDTDTDRVKLHFEIRRYGKPLDPLNYLPERS
ncbi:MAG: peptidoglycan DD-metalloendopeptidase family protein [Sulfuriferula multivorans]|uniref:Peptidoglycan DD-metalloendopeptidase family protein n=1 Tax=Sulfuriferula multivorans TaxID=1559896 RepID=A0A7C9TB56_9PROT|nr:peptidoglycan DD-metalloendopeptidase family protein [Sulfuriferula multivorans]